MNPTEVVQSCTCETSIQPLVDVTCSQWRTRRPAGTHCILLDFGLRAKVTSIPIQSMCSWRSICLNSALNTVPGMRQALCPMEFFTAKSVSLFFFPKCITPPKHPIFPGISLCKAGKSYLQAVDPKKDARWSLVGSSCKDQPFVVSWNSWSSEV